jgi:hypothetical protein
LPSTEWSLKEATEKQEQEQKREKNNSYYELSLESLLDCFSFVCFTHLTKPDRIIKQLLNFIK